MILLAFLVISLVNSECLKSPPVPKNQSWVFHDSENDDILFISNGAFRVRPRSDLYNL